MLIGGSSSRSLAHVEGELSSKCASSAEFVRLRRRAASSARRGSQCRRSSTCSSKTKRERDMNLEERGQNQQCEKIMFSKLYHPAITRYRSESHWLRGYTRAIKSILAEKVKNSHLWDGSMIFWNILRFELFISWSNNQSWRGFQEPNHPHITLQSSDILHILWNNYRTLKRRTKPKETYPFDTLVDKAWRFTAKQQTSTPCEAVVFDVLKFGCRCEDLYLNDRNITTRTRCEATVYDCTRPALSCASVPSLFYMLLCSAAPTKCTFPRSNGELFRSFSLPPLVFPFCEASRT